MSLSVFMKMEEKGGEGLTRNVESVTWELEAISQPSDKE